MQKIRRTRKDKGKERRVSTRLKMSDAWRFRRTRQKRDGGTITIRLSPSTLQQVMEAAEQRAEPTAAFVKTIIELKMLGLPE
jgi:hypothetical protein